MKINNAYLVKVIYYYLLTLIKIKLKAIKEICKFQWQSIHTLMELTKTNKIV